MVQAPFQAVPTPASPAYPLQLAIIHTVAGLVPAFSELAARHLPGLAPFHMVDESLLKNTIREGSLSQLTMRRLAGQVWSAVDAGASAILVTCSSLGPAVDAAIPLCPVPLFRVDDGMAIAALRQGRRIGVLATLPTTLGPTSDLIARHAGASGVDVRIESHLCEGAFQRLAAGDRAAHDARVVEGFRALAPEVDAIVLAQASMAQALQSVAGEGATPVLTSPELGVLHVREALAAKGLPIG